MSVFGKRAARAERAKARHRTLIDYSNAELRDVIGDLRLTNMDLQSELSDTRIELAVARGEDATRATLDEMDRVMARARPKGADS